MSQYLENARRVLERAERGKGRARIDKPCKACVHYGGNLFGLALWPKCLHPIVELAAAQGEDEYAVKRLGEAGTQRSARSPYGTICCGPDAALFEPR